MSRMVPILRKVIKDSKAIHWQSLQRLKGQRLKRPQAQDNGGTYTVHIFRATVVAEALKSIQASWTNTGSDAANEVMRRILAYANATR